MKWRVGSTVVSGERDGESERGSFELMVGGASVWWWWLTLMASHSCSAGVGVGVGVGQGPEKLPGPCSSAINHMAPEHLHQQCH